MGQQRWLEEHRRQSHMINIGDRWPDTLETHRRLIEAVRPNKKRHRVRLPLDAAQPPRKTQRHEPSRETLAVFAYGQICAPKTAPARAARRGRCVGTPAGVGLGRSASRSCTHSGMRSAAFSRDLFWSWRALRLGLRIADSLGQHLVQFRLGLFRFARRFPLGHADYMGRY